MSAFPLPFQPVTFAYYCQLSWTRRFYRSFKAFFCLRNFNTVCKIFYCHSNENRLVSSMIGQAALRFNVAHCLKCCYLQASGWCDQFGLIYHLKQFWLVSWNKLLLEISHEMSGFEVFFSSLIFLYKSGRFFITHSYLRSSTIHKRKTVFKFLLKNFLKLLEKAQAEKSIFNATLTGSKFSTFIDFNDLTFFTLFNIRVKVNLMVSFVLIVQWPIPWHKFKFQSLALLLGRSQGQIPFSSFLSLKMHRISWANTSVVYFRKLRQLVRGDNCRFLGNAKSHIKWKFMGQLWVSILRVFKSK